ncbi:hypothetical protein F2Q69_00042165 [Brassica cretica]|uniref:Uncharacterized protein n=1 Tax=Brassica cretica TaxID=69181 RepID=A0A8S9NHK8_BRACR|nr:hypothetical protein F2Q69_00042165 [Brassica cretica]
MCLSRIRRAPSITRPNGHTPSDQFPRVKPSEPLFRKHQSSRLRHLQDAIISPELLHLRQKVSGSIAVDPGLE